MFKIQTVCLVAFVMLLPKILFAANWTVESARAEAFHNTEKKIDISAYPSQDPNVRENQVALKEGKQRIGNRYVTSEDFGYLVSELDESGNAKITMTYANDGHLMSVRIFSSSTYPRTGIVYCGPHNTECSEGELIFVHFYPSKDETFYFNREGKLDIHIRNGKEVRH